MVKYKPMRHIKNIKTGEPRDKRTKEYKNWRVKFDKDWVKVKKKPEGLGDVVEVVTRLSGAKTALKYFTDGKDCGCDKRQIGLNKTYSWKHPPCFTEEEFIWWHDFDYNKRLEKSKETKKAEDLATPDEIRRIQLLDRRFFKRGLSVCGDCGLSGLRNLKTMLDDITKVYETYK